MFSCCLTDDAVDETTELEISIEQWNTANTKLKTAISENRAKLNKAIDEFNRAQQAAYSEHERSHGLLNRKLLQ